MFTTSPRSPHRTVCFPPRDHPCALWSDLLRSLWALPLLWHLRLAENWIPFHFPAGSSALAFLSKSCTWLVAVTSELRSSAHSVCVVTRALSAELLLSPLAACGWDAVVLESVSLLSHARHWCRNPACTTHVVRPCFRGLQADVCTSCTSIVFRGRVLP